MTAQVVGLLPKRSVEGEGTVLGEDRIAARVPHTEGTIVGRCPPTGFGGQTRTQVTLCYAANNIIRDESNGRRDCPRSQVRIQTPDLKLIRPTVG